jgi:hypothetical protein
MVLRLPACRKLLPVLLALLGALPLDAAAQAGSSPRAWYEGIRALRPDAARGAAVQGLVLARDAGVLRFDRGQIHLLQPIAGRTVGAVFVGEGRFELAAPDEVETEQLRREYDVPALAQPFRAAVLLFTDSTAAELERALTLGALPPSADAQRELDEARDYVTYDEGVARDVLVPLINAGPGWFYAHFSEDRGDPMIFAVDPHEFEEITLSKRQEGGLKRREIVAQFHQAADIANGRSTPPEGLDLIKISSYDIETTIDDDLALTGRATAHLVRRAATYDWIPFQLYPTLEVDSVRWGDGTAAAFERPEESSDLWVDFSGSPPGEVQLTFFYSGEIAEQPRDLWVMVHTFQSWYPIYESLRSIGYRMTFHVPDRLTVNTVGTRLGETTADGVTTTTWETPQVDLLAFNVGEFESYTSSVEGAPDLTVYVDERAHRQYQSMLAQANRLLLVQEDMAEQVARDLRNSFRFYSEVYGPTTFESFAATEIFSAHGEAYPGVVLLSALTFQQTDEKGFMEMFRGHEVAHQWWGISVRPATYRDWWLAEGFSEFSGWWYAARARGDVERYHRRLETTRLEILERRDEAAPIALGRRAGADYQTVVYHKGAWVLHMLRTMLTDHDTGDDSVFGTVMNTFYTRYLGRAATTRAFQQVVEEVVGVDMGWFFDQWVYRSAIPTYTFSSNLVDQPDGTVTGSVRIRQEDVPDDFRMVVPILLDFGEQGTAIVQINVQGPLTEGELPPLPMRPRAITFNPDEAVLAETRTEDWRN